MDYFSCSKHKKKYEMFCRTCRVPFCKKCSVHKDHLTEKLADFVARQRGEIPMGEELKGLLSQINNSLVKLKAREATDNIDLIERKKKLDRMEYMIKHQKSIMTHNELVVYKVANILKMAADKAAIEAISKALESKIIIFLGAKKHLENDFSKMKSDIKTYKDYIHRSEIANKSTKNSSLMLTMVKQAIEKGTLNESFVLAMLLLKEKEYLQFGKQPRSVIGNYKCFPDVQQYFPIERMMELPLYSYGHGIVMSQPVPVDKKLNTSTCTCGCLSHNGVLALYVYNPKDEDVDEDELQEHMYFMQFTDLKTNEQFDVELPDHTTVGFYDDKIVFVISSQPLKEAPVSAIFEKKELSPLVNLDTHEAFRFTELTTLNVTRNAYYIDNKGNVIYEYNVDSKKEEIAVKGVRFSSLIPSTGIYMNYKTFFLEDNTNLVYGVNNENDKQIVLRNMGISTKYYGIFPSFSEPTNIKKAAFKTLYNLFYDDRNVEPEFEGQFSWGFTIIRLMKDIFLIFESSKHQWNLYRIIVP